MPFFIQQPPPINIPKTQIELKYQRNNEENNNQLKHLDFNKDAQNIYAKETFYSLKAAWENNTMFSSSVQKIVEDRNFKRIVEMGPIAIPFIIESIEKQPSSLVWALNLITGTTLRTSYRLTVTDACKMWVKLHKKGEIKV